jgi:hypothetical protein
MYNAPICRNSDDATKHFGLGIALGANRLCFPRFAAPVSSKLLGESVSTDAVAEILVIQGAPTLTHHGHGDVDCPGCSRRTEPLYGRLTHRSHRTGKPRTTFRRQLYGPSMRCTSEVWPYHGGPILNTRFGRAKSKKPRWLSRIGIQKLTNQR